MEALRTEDPYDLMRAETLADPIPLATRPPPVAKMGTKPPAPPDGCPMETAVVDHQGNLID